MMTSHIRKHADAAMLTAAVQDRVSTYPGGQGLLYTAVERSAVVSRAKDTMPLESILWQPLS